MVRCGISQFANGNTGLVNLFRTFEKILGTSEDYKVFFENRVIVNEVNWLFIQRFLCGTNAAVASIFCFSSLCNIIWMVHSAFFELLS